MAAFDLPALHKSASALSDRSQKTFFTVLGANLSLLVFAALLSSMNSSDHRVAIVQTLAISSALLCSIFLATFRPEKVWYTARAIAESVKTLAWKFAMKSEPFDGADEQARNEFLQRLRTLAMQNATVLRHATSHLEAEHVTQAMIRVRQHDFVTRRQHYRDFRIADQLSWYANKSATNDRAARLSFGLLILLNAIGVVLAIAKVSDPKSSYWIDLFITSAAGILTWMQAKRYSELSGSYALAATEIGLIRDQLPSIEGEAAFSVFVSDSEMAFSREHTQWIARRDAR